MKQPGRTEYKDDYEDYVSLIEETDVVSAMRKQLTEARNLFASFSEEKGEFAYAEGKWTIKELLGHLINGERVFSYRALRISRGDETPLAGFDQDLLTDNGNFNAVSLANLLKEYSYICQANIIFFQNLTDEAWARTGTVNDTPASVRAIAYNMVNHVRHHLDSLRVNYLVENNKNMSVNQEFLQNLYDAFNKREIETIISKMHPDVKWANGLEGGFVYGRDAAREYWTNQFKTIQPKLEALKFETDEKNRNVVTVHQIIKDLEGTVLVDTQVRQIFTIEDNLITLYEIGETDTINEMIQKNKVANER